MRCWLQVQALNEILMHTASTAASFASGVLLHHGGWELVNWLAVPWVGATALCCGYLLACRRGVGAVAAAGAGGGGEAAYEEVRQ